MSRSSDQASCKRAGANVSNDFTGRRILVMGGSSGVGKACVDYFLGLGAVVASLDVKHSDATHANHRTSTRTFETALLCLLP